MRSSTLKISFVETISLSGLRHKLSYIFKLLAYFLLVGCSSPIENINTDIKSEKPLVLTTFTILADMARNVAGDRLNVVSITKLGAEIHGYKPTPSDLIQASKADLIIENGLGLELWSKKFTNTAGDVPTVVLTKGMQPLLIEGDTYAGRPNPHAWMSPNRAIIYVDNILKAFVKLDPAGASFYKKNAQIYQAKLRNLDEELRRHLSTIPPKSRVLVTCEGAFSYLAHDYQMDEAYLWPVNAESQVTPKRMLKLIKTVKQRQVPTIFCESTVSSKTQREVAKASGASFGGNFFVDSLSESSGPASTLLDLQRHNVRLIRKGLAPDFFLNE